MGSRGLVIQPYERTAVIGMTGSGKTHLMKAYANGFKNVMVLDTKGTFKWGNVPVVRTLSELQTKGEGKFIYRPIDSEMNEDFYDAFFEFCYKRRNTVVFVDELAQIMESANNPLPNWKNIMQRGRELKVGIINCTQRPRFVPRMTFSEAEHTFCFRLKLEDDRKSLAEYMGRDVVDVRLKKHGFIYMNESQERPTIMADGLPL